MAKILINLSKEDVNDLADGKEITIIPSVKSFDNLGYIVLKIDEDVEDFIKAEGDEE